MNLTKHINEDCFIIDESIKDKTALLKKIAKLAFDSGLLGDISENEIFKGLEQRELLGSTGFGEKIAIPHCRLDNVPVFLVGMIVVPKGIEFNSIDGKKVKIFAFIIGPKTESDNHIKILSSISHILSIPNARKKILKSKDSKELKHRFLSFYSEEKSSKKSNITYQKVSVILQDEDILYPILQVFNSFDTTSTTILNSENPMKYLNKIPIFADILDSERSMHSKHIIALVGKDNINETIRRIEQITGPLNEQDDIIVFVENLFYCAGNLHY